MLQFKLDWEDSPRVRDLLLQRTWARLEIHGGDATRKYCFTECVGVRSFSLRQGVYGSVFPLAKWIVEKWWSLLYESIRVDRFHGGRADVHDTALKQWLQRHNLLAARGGFALPDLSLYHDGGTIALRCIPDSFDCDTAYPVRFVSAAVIRLEISAVESGLREFVDMVAERVQELCVEEPEAIELLENWEAVKESARNERELCAAAAALGMDCYDPTEMTDELLNLLEKDFVSLVPSLQHDLAESSSGETLGTDLEWLHSVAGEVAIQNGHTARAESKDRFTLSAHEAGYQAALRMAHSTGFTGDLEGFVRDQLGWPAPVEPSGISDGVANRISGYLGLDKSGRLRLVSTGSFKHEGSRRFLIGRALFLSTESGVAPRLLSRASSWSQRASRAFAAELLAPAASLKELVSGYVSFEQVAELARTFGVSEMVIEHQLENHHIARIVDL